MPITDAINVQDVFNKVIDAGYYSDYNDGYMCDALETAEENGVISLQEYHAAHRAVNEYINDQFSLGVA